MNSKCDNEPLLGEKMEKIELRKTGLQKAEIRKIEQLKQEIQKCTLCSDFLPFGPRPVIRAGHSARILIAGQAPGRRVHESGIPFNDPSGDRLREWLGITEDIFYDDSKIALVPMGFCYPGTGKTGDLAPRKECAETWRADVMEALPNIELTLLVGQYAMAYHLTDKKQTLTEKVRNWQSYAPAIIPLPHPSPRNNIWLKRNPWFEEELLPELKRRIKLVLQD